MKFYQTKRRLFSALALSAGLLLLAGGAASADSVKTEKNKEGAALRVELDNMPEAVQGYQISFSVTDSSGNPPANVEWSSGDDLKADVLRGNYANGILQVIVADDERTYGGEGKATLDLGQISLPKNQSYTLELIPGSFKGASGSLSNLGTVLDKEEVKIQVGDSPTKPDGSSSAPSRPSGGSNRPSGSYGGSYGGGDSSSSREEVSSKPVPVSSKEEAPSSEAVSSKASLPASSNAGQGNTTVSQEVSSKEEDSSMESSSESSKPSSAEEEDQPTNGETPPSQPEEEATSFPLLWVIIGLAVIAVIAAVVVFLRSNNRKHH